MYAWSSGLRAAVKAELLRRIGSTYLRPVTRKLVVVYCFFPSHYQNLRGIPELLTERIESCDVWVLCNFKTMEYEVKIDSANILIRQNIPYHVCRLIKADLFLSPMVGLSPCSMPFGSKSIHFLVSLAGLDGVYLDHHFDGWDYIFCAGESQIADFKRLARRRDIAGIKLIRGGYPKLDDQIISARRSGGAVAGAVIYAPTHVYQGNDKLATLLSHGERIVEQLLQLGIKTIFRPHPASLVHVEDMAVIKRICDRHRGNALFKLDDSKDYSGSYAEANIMVTDLSGTGFTFAFAFERPVIFFAPNVVAEEGLQGTHFTDRERIGKVIRDLDKLRDSLHEIEMSYDSYVKKISTYRDESVFNVGRSRESFIESVADIIRNRDNLKWEVL